MSWQEGDGPDPTEFRGPLNPAAEVDYLSAAAGWLGIAEQEFEQLKDGVLQEGGREYIPRGGGYALLTEGSARLAELNIAMAMACGKYQNRKPRIVQAENADYVAAMEKRLGEQLKADDEAFQAVTLRPGVDPEPEAEGELWTDDGQRFVYAVASFRTPDDSEAPRWLLARHYAQVLRWQSAPEPKSSLETWEGLDGKIGWSDDAPLRRPTAEERAAFYGPEPDPQPAIEEAHERTTTPPPATLGEAFRTPYGGAAEPPEEPVRFDRFDATVEAFSDEALIVMREALNREQGRRIVKRERPQRAYTEPEDRGMFRDRG